jgi:hypothetical protein
MARGPGQYLHWILMLEHQEKKRSDSLLAQFTGRNAEGANNGHGYNEKDQPGL